MTASLGMVGCNLKLMIAVDQDATAEEIDEVAEMAVRQRLDITWKEAGT